MKMIKILCCSIYFSTTLMGYSADKKVEQEPVVTNLKIMTFNTWFGGGNSIAETAKVFVESGADIIGVQESMTHQNKNTTKYLADSLGWSSYTYRYSQAIISKHPIVDTSAYGNGVKIEYQKGRFAWLFSVHLNYCPYGPYQLAGIEYCDQPVLKTAEEAIAAANAKRAEDAKVITDDILKAKEEGWPVFVTGDFNEPSYQDWTQDAVDAGMCSMVVEWPSVKTFVERGGLIDSYREKFPNVIDNPGYTWTSQPPAEGWTELYDRIDFILYWKCNDKISVLNSQLLGEDSELSDIRFTNYPSDHRAVLSTFEIK